MAVIHEQPSHVTEPEPSHGVIRIFVLVAACMMADMIRCPFQRRVLQRPAASDQQSPLDPIRAIETPMSKQAMIPDGNPQTRNDIEEAEHGPIHPGVIIKI